MSTYKITATVEKINLSGKLSVCLKGVGKYLFEKDKEKKIYWNVFECKRKRKREYERSNSKFVKTDTKISFQDQQGVLILLSHAFSQKTKLKCEIKELEEIREIEEKDSKYTLLSISNDTEN